MPTSASSGSCSQNTARTDLLTLRGSAKLRGLISRMSWNVRSETHLVKMSARTRAELLGGFVSACCQNETRLAGRDRKGPDGPSAVGLGHHLRQERIGRGRNRRTT